MFCQLPPSARSRQFEPFLSFVGGDGLEPSNSKRADLQSAAIATMRPSHLSDTIELNYHQCHQVSMSLRRDSWVMTSPLGFCAQSITQNLPPQCGCATVTPVSVLCLIYHRANRYTKESNQSYDIIKHVKNSRELYYFLASGLWIAHLLLVRRFTE